MLLKHRIFLGLMGGGALTPAAAFLWAGLSTDNGTEEKTSLLSEDLGTPEAVETLAEIPRPFIDPILLSPQPLDTMRVAFSPMHVDSTIEWPQNIASLRQQFVNETPSAAAITETAIVVEQTASPLPQLDFTLPPIDFSAVGANWQNMNWPNVMAWSAYPLSTGFDFPTIAALPETRQSAFDRVASLRADETVRPPYAHSLLMGYAPTENGTFDPIQALLQIPSGLPLMTEEQTRPTRTASRTEDSCSGPRWTILNAEGTVVADSERRALIACPMASLTKVMTLYLAFQAFSEENGFTPETQVQIPADVAHHLDSRAYTPVARTGRTYSAGELAALTGRRSDAIATLGLAYATGKAMGLQGNVDQVLGGFITLMNATAQELGLTNTVFNNPVGFTYQNRISDFASLSNVSTAEDMARLLMATYEQDPTWTQHSLGNDGHYRHRHTLASVRDDSADFGKSGTTDAAGRAAVVSFEVSGQRFYAAVLDSNAGMRARDVRSVIAEARRIAPTLVAGRQP